MDTIIFNISKEDKEALKKIAESERLRLGSYCRFILTKKIQEAQIQN